MSVELEPSELSFRRPFDNEVLQVLRIRNPNKSPLAFKVKTTAPKQYCVRPNSGRIEPGESVEVNVVLQPMKQDPAADVRCKDKFLVQSIVIPDSKDTLAWADLEREHKGSIIERKIRVSYLPADGSSKQAQALDDTIDDSAHIAPPVYTPHASSSATVDDTPIASSAFSSSTKGTAGTSVAAPSIEWSRDELTQQLEQANATIAQLRKDAEEGLRKRLPSKETVTTTLAPQPLQQSGQTGVPVPTVALISLFVFLLTYLLF